MFEVKTNKEYQALLKEIEMIKESNSREEEEILRLMDEIEEVKKDLSRREKEMTATLSRIDAEKSVIQGGIKESEVVWNRELARRDSLSKQLDATLFRLYTTLKEKRQGIGVVAVKRETCQGCFVNVPPQMYIEVQKNNALVRCPNCNRILYWEDRSENKR